MQINRWIFFTLFFIAKGQYLLSGGMCGGGFFTRVHPAYNLQECEFNCDRDGKYYNRINVAQSFSYGSFVRGRGDCLCSTQCSCKDTRRPNYEVSLNAGSQRLAPCAQGTVQGMNLESCHFSTDITWTKTMWVKYECKGPSNHATGVTLIFYDYQTHCRQNQHIQRSFDFSMNECFEHFPGEQIKVSYCSGNQLRFTFCENPTASPTVTPSTTSTLKPWPQTSTVQPTYPAVTPHPSSSQSFNASMMIGQEKANGGTSVGLELTLPFLIAVIATIICLWGVCYLIIRYRSNKSKQDDNFEHILLEEDTRESWFESTQERDHWQTPVRAYPDPIEGYTEPIDASHNAHMREMSKDLNSVHDHYGGRTLPVTPNQHGRDYFWKRDPSLDSTLSSYNDAPQYAPHYEFYPHHTQLMGGSVNERQSEKYTEDYHSEHMTDDSFGDGRSTNRSASTGVVGDGFTKRYSLRAVDTRHNKFNDLSDVVVISKQLANYLKERNLQKFIPDLESFGVSRSFDLLQLHRSDINSFTTEPTKEERQKLENLFLLGASE